MTKRQSEHQDYLSGDKWKRIRKNVLKRDRCICQRCGDWAEEVHHKTYKNWKNEKLNDLESLCSMCHDTHHRVKKVYGKSSEIILSAIFGFLNEKQKEKLISDFKLKNQEALYSGIFLSDNYELKIAATKMLGSHNFKN